MLIPGIKLGPTDWQAKLTATQAAVAEVWYRIDWSEKYKPMIGELQKRGVRFGFHFWGITSSGYEANLSYPGQNQSESIELIRRCIDEASAAEANYVNIHSGNYGLMVINFEQQRLYPDETVSLIDPLEAAMSRNRILKDLGSYAQSRNVELLVEAIPAKIADGQWWDPQAKRKPLDEYPTPLTGLEDLCEQRLIGFTNDFCHTFLMDVFCDASRDQLYQQFLQTTTNFAAYTEVVHINTIMAPYNGTDSHDGILPDELAHQTVFPTKHEFISLFALLQNAKPSKDIWLIGEPKANHVENYVALKDLLYENGF